MGNTFQDPLCPWFPCFLACSEAILSPRIQCLAFVLLVIKSHSSGSVAGISAKSLALEALAFSCRLSSTTWLNGPFNADPLKKA